MKYIKIFEKFISENKPKGAPDWHDSDAPDAEGRFKDLSPKDLAAWLIKTRDGDLKKISGSLTQQIVFNRNEDPEYADKMEKTRKEVYKKLGREDLLDKMDERVNLNKVEDYADDVLDPTDVEFTRHFFDRLTRIEHDKDITDAELIGFFKRLAKKKKQFDSFIKQYDEFIVKDKRTDLNIPFVKRVNQIIAKTIMRKKDFISSNPAYTFEAYMVNEIGDASAKPMKYKVLGKDIKSVLGSFDSKIKTNSKGNGEMSTEFTWEFTNDEGVKYICKLDGTIHKEKVLQLSFDNIPKEPKYDRYVFLTASFNLAGREQHDESQTNMNEQFRVLSTVVFIIKNAIKDIIDAGFRIDAINIPPKGDLTDSPSNIDSKRGRFYLAYLKRSIKSLPGKWSVINRKYNNATYFALVPGKLSGANIIATTEAKSNDSFNDYPIAAKTNAKKN